MSKILVIGSSNTDLIAKVKKFPHAGETIAGEFFSQEMGGKGANQAVAAKKLGGDVQFITCLGTDANGRNAMDYYKNQGLDVSLSLVVEDVPSGVALIMVDGNGENCIVIIPGANNELFTDYLNGLEKVIANVQIVVLQMEIPYETVKNVCRLAKKHQKLVILNVAPAREIDEELLANVDILVVNETEAETITGKNIKLEGMDQIVDDLLSKGAKTVILTLGKEGSVWKSGTTLHHFPSYSVNTVDSTAAGDTFCGALAAEISRGKNLAEAIQFSTAAAAICVTRMGAQSSLPTVEEVRKFLKSRVPYNQRRTVRP